MEANTFKQALKPHPLHNEIMDVLARKGDNTAKTLEIIELIDQSQLTKERIFEVFSKYYPTHDLSKGGYVAEKVQSIIKELTQ